MVVKLCVALNLLNAFQHLNIAFEEFLIVDLLLVVAQRVVLLNGRAGQLRLIVGSGHRQLLASLNIDKFVEKTEITFLLFLVLVMVLEAPSSL